MDTLFKQFEDLGQDQFVMVEELKHYKLKSKKLGSELQSAQIRIK